MITLLVQFRHFLLFMFPACTSGLSSVPFHYSTSIQYSARDLIIPTVEFCVISLFFALSGLSVGYH